MLKDKIAKQITPVNVLAVGAGASFVVGAALPGWVLGIPLYVLGYGLMKAWRKEANKKELD